MISFGFVKAFDLDPGGTGGGGGGDLIAPYITITPNSDFAWHTVHVEGKATDFGSGVKNVKLYIDDVWIKTSTSSTCSHSWDTSGYSDKSVHTIKIIAEDNADNERTSTKSYIIGYTEDTLHYSNPNGYTGGEEIDLGTIAYTKIECDLFGLILLVEGHQVLNGGIPDTMLSFFDVTMMYYCLDEHRFDYNLDPTERPSYAPDGTLVELNFEMEETNTILADQAIGDVRDNWDDDRLMWPNFGTPDGVAAGETAMYILKKTIGVIVGFLPISKLAGFSINLVKDFIVQFIKIGDEDPQTTGSAGANPVDITYRNLNPNGQSVLYPENNYNYAYDGISRHRIQFEYRTDSAFSGQTLGLKFRCNVQYKDSRTSTIDSIFSDWVKIEFILN
ncbi:MAG: Ig-like domain-containing protein [Candidatus Heimdallarchaeota archaeon]